MMQALIEAIRADAEAWKFTRLDAIAERQFTPASESVSSSGAHDAAVVFHNGVLAGDTKLPKGVELAALGDDKNLAGYLDHPRLRDHPVGKQSLALTAGGIGLKITGKIPAPVEIVFTGGGDDVSAHPVIAVDIADGAEATLLERHGGEGTGIAMPVMGVRLGKGARLRHGRVQTESATRHHLGAAVFTLAEDAHYDGISVQTGAAISRSESHFALTGEGGQVNLTTLYLARGNQLMDVTAHVAHEAPSCTSMQTVRGVLDDEARGVFQGKVLVAQDAQHTDGNQMSRALLLSRDCEADAKPELEIYADDVKCSHGATVGEIDAGHLFYLMSRGITEHEARQILIEAFLADALDEMDDETLRDFAMPAVTDWLDEMKSGRR